MNEKLIKSWKDENNRRWYLYNTDDYPYISSTSIVAVAKAFRYKDYKKDDKAAKRLQQAAQIGTDIHSVLEQYNRKQLGQTININGKLVVRYKQILENYIDLVKLISLNEGEVKVIAVERACLNPMYKYAGRFDLLVTINGEYEVWDYKTSKQVREEDGWQLASYMLALILEGISVKRVRIIHIDKISSKITDLKYQHHDYMIQKFLHCLEIFKGIYFNDLLKGRIQDIEELGIKYKWPLEELTRNYLIHFNNNKENIMELKEVTGLGDSKTFTKDPTRVDFSEGEVMGVILGAVPSRWVHKAKKKVYACPGKDRCERCKFGMKKTVQFKANFLTLDSSDKPVIKRIESESVRLFFALNKAIKDITDAGGDPKTAVLRIERTGKGFDTDYQVENIAPKHKAFKDVAATIKDMEGFDLEFAPTDEDAVEAPTDKTDIVEN